MSHVLLSEAFNGHAVSVELLGDVLGGLVGDFDPCLGEHCTGSEDKDDVDKGLDRRGEDVEEVSWGGEEVDEAIGGDLMAAHVDVLPGSNESDKEVSFEVLVEDLGEEEQVGNQGALKDDGHVGSVEEFDGIRLFVSLCLLTADSQFNSEALEVDDKEDDSNRGNQVEKIRSISSVERLAYSFKLVTLGDQEMEECNHTAFKLRIAS